MFTRAAQLKLVYALATFDGAMLLAWLMGRGALAAWVGGIDDLPGEVVILARVVVLIAFLPFFAVTISLVMKPAWWGKPILATFGVAWSLLNLAMTKAAPLSPPIACGLALIGLAVIAQTLDPRLGRSTLP